jgi:hypothetical protein
VAVLEPVASAPEPAWAVYPPPEEALAQAVGEVLEQVIPPDPEPPASPEPDASTSTAPFPYLVSPIPLVTSEEVRMLTVVLRPCGDKVRDGLRLRQVYGTLISYPGNDRFALLVYENGRGYQIEFPNFTTGLNPDLLNRLHRLVGAENVRTEPLKFH